MLALVGQVERSWCTGAYQREQRDASKHGAHREGHLEHRVRVDVTRHDAREKADGPEESVAILQRKRPASLERRRAEALLVEAQGAAVRGGGCCCGGGVRGIGAVQCNGIPAARHLMCVRVRVRVCKG